MHTNYLLLALTLINFALIYWGTVKFFKVRGEFVTKDLKILRIMTVTTWISCLVGLTVFPAPGLISYPGCVLSAIAVLTFLTATRAAAKIEITLVYSKDLPSKLLIDGPYKWVRHPFYTSYLLCYLGASLGSRSWLPYLATMIMLAIYIRAARIEELKFQNSELAREYAEYRSRVWAFFPKFF